MHILSQSYALRVVVQYTEKKASRNRNVKPALETKNTNTILKKILAMPVHPHKLEVVPYFFLILQNPKCMTYLDGDK